MQAGKCPRCSSTKLAKLAETTLQLTKSRAVKVVVYECADCKLIFYEGL